MFRNNNMNCFQLICLVVAFFYCCWSVDGLVLSTEKPSLIKYRRDYIQMEEFNEFIKINTKRKTWHEAKAYCEFEGGSLAVIRTEAEAKAIVEVLKSVPEKDRYLWIGLQDLIAEGEFETIDGEPIAEVFGDWDIGEPNDAGGNEDCVVFTAGGKLNDENCKTKRPFLCKKEASTVTPNSDCNNFDPAYKQVLNGEQCIKFHTTPKTWEEAYIICVAEMGHLAVINSQKEADLYVEEFAKHPKDTLKGNFNKDNLFLGFHDKFTEGDFEVVTGGKLDNSGYVNWSHGQPDNRDNDENCGSMFRTGQLNDISCTKAKAMFICEMPLSDPQEVFLNSRIQHQ